MFKSFFAREATPAKPVLTTSVALQNDLWVIHPPADGDAALPTSMGEDTMVRGVASFVSEPNALLWDVRIALVVQYSYRLPGTSRWEQAIVYEQGQTFKHDDPEDPVQVFSMNDGKEIKRQIEFGMLLPRSLATYEHLPNAKIIPQIRVTAEFSKNTWSAAALAALPRSPPVYVDSEESKEIAGRRFISESWRGGSVLIDREGELGKRIATGTIANLFVNRRTGKVSRFDIAASTFVVPSLTNMDQELCVGSKPRSNCRSSKTSATET